MRSPSSWAPSRSGSMVVVCRVRGNGVVSRGAGVGRAVRRVARGRGRWVGPFLSVTTRLGAVWLAHPAGGTTLGLPSTAGSAAAPVLPSSFDVNGDGRDDAVVELPDGAVMIFGAACQAPQRLGGHRGRSLCTRSPSRR